METLVITMDLLHIFLTNQLYLLSYTYSTKIYSSKFRVIKLKWICVYFKAIVIKFDQETCEYHDDHDRI